MCSLEDKRRQRRPLAYTTASDLEDICYAELGACTSGRVRPRPPWPEKKKKEVEDEAEAKLLFSVNLRHLGWELDRCVVDHILRQYKPKAFTQGEFYTYFPLRFFIGKNPETYTALFISILASFQPHNFSYFPLD